ncbi:plasmid stabilization system [Oscillatoria nigro-viridis PCC 7112]|uniref:Plasmid stabilization system n=1 Tax=Phormidium nigroviride PCC 7112 TaxID=179408 RepID=K9VRG8_9CYAN|nr:type II toxin-antitoxin system RelE/ParE family toxin [Oscillatoria nigro-viridis]AFZ10077.1 plasmid stabilization system [Oscillatoria nigro-viridis PCC 7112]
MSNYTVYIRPQAFQEIKSLPGNIRQRVRQAIRELAENPRPPQSKQLDVSFELDLWRLRIDNWRIVYAITEADKIVDVFTVRKRPPYNYEDLEKLLADIKDSDD